MTKGLPPDVLHDLLEGVAPYEIALVTHKLIDSGVVTLAQINMILESWHFGQLDALDRPCKFPADFHDKIPQNAARTWCLLRLYPLMLGQILSEENQYVNFIVELKQIVEMATSFSLSIPDISLLEMKTQDHLETFKDLFPEKSLLPKHHFLLHYGQAYLQFGPLRHYWCMRFEAKHAYFKRLAKIANNFKNILLTLANRHQRFQAYVCSSSSSMCHNSIKLSKTSEVNINNLSQYEKTLFDNVHVSLHTPQATLHECRFATINGIAYHRNMIVVIKCDSEGIQFGQIMTIYVESMEPLFRLRICQSYFEHMYGAYCILLTGEFVILKYIHLSDYYPLFIYNVRGKKYVILKNYIYNTKDFTV